MADASREQVPSDDGGWTADAGPVLLLQAARDSLRLVVDPSQESGLDIPMQRARDALRSTDVVFCALDPAGELVVRAAADPESEQVGVLLGDLGHLAREVMASGVATRTDAVPASAEPAADDHPRAMAAPVVSGGTVVGVLSVTRDADLPAFSEGELSALATFGDLLGLVTDAERQRADREADIEPAVRRRFAALRLDALTGSLLRAGTGLARLRATLDAEQREQLGQYIRVVDELLVAFRESVANGHAEGAGDAAVAGDVEGHDGGDGQVRSFTGPYVPEGRWDWEDGSAVFEMEAQVASILSDIYAVTVTLAAAAHTAPDHDRELISRSVDQLDELTRRVRAASARFLASQTEEGRLDRQLAELTETDTFLLDQISMVGHDLREPMSVVVMYLELLTDDDLTDAQADRLGRALRAARRVLQLLERILALAVTESGDLTSEPQVVDLDRFLRELLPTIRRGDEVAYDADTATGVDVLFDPAQLGQILANLISNAFRHGTPPVTVRVRAGPSATTIEVSDHGAGVPDDQIDHLFDRRLLTTRPASDGLLDPGLGLYLCHRLAQANNATLIYVPRTGHACAHFALTIPTHR